MFIPLIFRQSTIPQRLHPGGRKCLYLSYFASLLDLEGYNRVEKVFVSLTFLQFVRPQRLHPGEKSVCTSYFRQFIRPQRLQPSGESVCNNDEEDFASS